MDLELPQRHSFLGPAVLWKRALAFIIDLFVIDLFIFSSFRQILLSSLGSSAGFSATYHFLLSNSEIRRALLYVFILVSLFVLSYFILLEYLTGQTIGKMIVNILVVSVRDPNRAGTPGFLQCLVRSIFLFPVVPFIILWLIDPIYYLFNKDQRFLEYLSQTRVVERFVM
ncbi:RDD family protein [Candidatus Woesearchaeota archaeon]|nr:RDD family protein [Candidatus Woesearchaeota archaeon]